MAGESLILAPEKGKGAILTPQKLAEVITFVGAFGAAWFFSGGFCLICGGSGRTNLFLKTFGVVDGGSCVVCGGDGQVLG